MTQYRRRCLVLSVSGIGNTILQSQTILQIQKHYETYVVFGSKSMRSVLENQLLREKTFVLSKSLISNLKLLLRLRRIKFDYSVALFPSNRDEFHLFMFVIGAQKRIIHDYKEFNSRLSFLSNLKVEAKEDLHDVDQNLNLLEKLEIRPEKEKRVYFFLSEKNLEFARAFFKKNQINHEKEKILSVSVEYGPIGPLKSYPLSYYKDLLSLYLKHSLFDRILIFSSKTNSSRQLYRSLSENFKSRVFLIEEDLKNSAAILSLSRFFLGNDSAFSHIAAAFSLKTCTIFGPTNEIRTKPFSEKSFVIKRNDLLCRPCLKYPFSSRNTNLKCLRLIKNEREKFPLCMKIDPLYVFERTRKFYF